MLEISALTFFFTRIGFSIAKRLVGDGADVMVSSRKEENVKSAVDRLRKVEGAGKVEGVVCHVGKSDHRTNLIKEVCAVLIGLLFWRVSCGRILR